MLCDPIDCSLPGSSSHGIFQAIVLEWVAISFSRGSSQTRAQTRVSRMCRQALYRLSHQGSPFDLMVQPKVLLIARHTQESHMTAISPEQRDGASQGSLERLSKPTHRNMASLVLCWFKHLSSPATLSNFCLSN